jgi:three-Cys-motif partner protein
MPKKDENTLDGDGLIAPVVGSWSAEKYGLITYYANIFSRAMKNSIQHLTYVDLYAGSGRANIKERSEFVDTSALLALKTTPPFSSYIFCDINPEKISALKTRADRLFPQAKKTFVQGDARTSASEILRAIPQHKAGFKVLSFCVIDPFNTSSFNFEILEQLGQKRMDFMILIPSGMDIGRNMGYYAEEGNVGLEKFLGDPEWRGKWEEFQKMNRKNADFVVDQFCEKMVRLGYQDSRMFLKPIYMTGTKRLLYHLAYFSKHPLGLDFWKKALKGTTHQTSLLEGL